MSSSRDRVIWDRPERTGHGPAPSLSREEITTAAVTLADTQGIEAVSMRAIAVALGVGAASLYRYVARKDELIDLMVDAVIGDDLQFEPGGAWREDLRSFAHGLRAMTLRHPWMAVQGAGLRSFGPNEAHCHEQVLSSIDGLGLEIDQMLVMVETLGAYVRGRTLEDLSEQEAVRRSGMDQQAWMQTQTPYIESLIASGRFPLLTRVVFDARSPHDPDRIEHGFELGLERVLDGLATMLPPSGRVRPARLPRRNSPLR
jgi:AcrR family transcriptional regulator